MTWWKRATTAQRLAQVDGAIEVGMTQAQCAMNCRTTLDSIASFAMAHGRRFPHKGKGTTRAKRTPAVFDVASQPRGPERLIDSYESE